MGDLDATHCHSRPGPRPLHRSEVLIRLVRPHGRMAWKCTSPRRWNSATLQCSSRRTLAHSARERPRDAASWQRRRWSSAATARRYAHSEARRRRNRSSGAHSGVPTASSSWACREGHRPEGVRGDSADRRPNGRSLAERHRCTSPKPGAVRVKKTAGWAATDSSMPLPPSSPARIR